MCLHLHFRSTILNSEKLKTNLFTHSRESIQESNRVDNKLVQIGDNSSLMYGRNLKKAE